MITLTEEQLTRMIEELEQDAIRYCNELAHVNSLMKQEVAKGSSNYHKLQKIVASYKYLAIATSSRVITLKALLKAESLDEAKTCILMDLKAKEPIKEITDEIN